MGFIDTGGVLRTYWMLASGMSDSDFRTDGQRDLRTVRGRRSFPYVVPNVAENGLLEELVRANGLLATGYSYKHSGLSPLQERGSYYSES